ncbi:hypothetical protein AAHC03_024342 [Spirometra sp. Aus1]
MISSFFAFISLINLNFYLCFPTDIQQDLKGFEFSIIQSASDELPTAIYCYIGKKVQAQTITVLEPNYDDKRLSTFIWHRLNGRQVNLNDKGTHFLRLDGLKPEDVVCRRVIWGRHKICEVKPGSFEIHWIVKTKTYPEVIKTLRTEEPVSIEGILTYCSDSDIVFPIHEPLNDLHQTFSLHHRGQLVRPEAMTRRFLEEALPSDCSSDAAVTYA